MAENKIDFRYPSYVQDILGPMCFDYGFGPFRWVCTSGLSADLDKTDAIAARVLEEIRAGLPSHVTQDLDAPIELTDAEIRERMSGNICRCGAYANIVTAIREVAQGDA